MEVVELANLAMGVADDGAQTEDRRGDCGKRTEHKSLGFILVLLIAVEESPGQWEGPFVELARKLARHINGADVREFLQTGTLARKLKQPPRTLDVCGPCLLDRKAEPDIRRAMNNLSDVRGADSIACQDRGNAIVRKQLGPTTRHHPPATPTVRQHPLKPQAANQARSSRDHGNRLPAHFASWKIM